MASYRLYHLGAGGRLQLGPTFACADDQEAVAVARRALAVGQAGELWCGGRMVGRFSKLGAFTPADTGN